MSILYHSNKDNMFSDDLCSITMGSVPQVDECKKDLVKDFNRLAWLGVRLENSPNCGFVVHHNSEEFVVVLVMSNQYLDNLLRELNE